MLITGANRGIGLAVNALWQGTALKTAAVQNLPGGDRATQIWRTPAIMADAAHVILTAPSREFTGRLRIDDPVLRDTRSDFTRHRVTPESDTLLADFFVPYDVNKNPGDENRLMMELPEQCRATRDKRPSYRGNMVAAVFAKYCRNTLPRLLTISGRQWLGRIIMETRRGRGMRPRDKTLEKLEHGDSSWLVSSDSACSPCWSREAHIFTRGYRARSCPAR